LDMYEDFGKNFPDVIILPETTARPLYYTFRPVFEKLKQEKGTTVPKFVFFNIRAIKPRLVQSSQEKNVGHEIKTGSELKKLIEEEQELDMEFLKKYPEYFKTENDIDELVKNSEVEKIAESRKIAQDRADEIKDYLKKSPGLKLAILDDYLSNQNTVNDIRKAFKNNQMPAYAIMGTLGNSNEDSPSAKSGYVFTSGEKTVFEEDPNPAFGESGNYAFSYRSSDPIGVKKEYNKKYSSVINPSPEDAGKFIKDKEQLRKEMKFVGENIATTISDLIDKKYEDAIFKARESIKYLLDIVKNKKTIDSEHESWYKLYLIHVDHQKKLFTLEDIGSSEVELEDIDKYYEFKKKDYGF